MNRIERNGDHLMPMFNFEKLSGIMPRDAATDHSKKKRGALTRLLDRFAEVRLQQTEATINRVRMKSGAPRGRLAR